MAVGYNIAIRSDDEPGAGAFTLRTAAGRALDTNMRDRRAGARHRAADSSRIGIQQHAVLALTRGRQRWAGTFGFVQNEPWTSDACETIEGCHEQKVTPPGGDFKVAAGLLEQQTSF